MKKLAFLFCLFFINTSFAQEEYNTWYYQTNKTTVANAKMALVLSNLNEVNNNKLMLVLGKMKGETIQLNRVQIQSDRESIDCYFNKKQCFVNVKFDNDDFEQYQIFESAGLMVIEPVAKFINAVRKSKTLTLELSALGNPKSKYTFNTENLKLFNDDVTEWHYTKESNGNILSAFIYSNYPNDIPSYSASNNRLYISLNKHEKDFFIPVFYFIDNYILCEVETECYISVSFDNESPKKYKVIAQDTKVIFQQKVELVEDKIDFINKLLLSKKVFVEVKTARGNKKFDFDTSGLKLN